MEGAVSAKRQGAAGKSQEAPRYSTRFLDEDQASRGVFFSDSNSSLEHQAMQQWAEAPMSINRVA